MILAQDRGFRSTTVGLVLVALVLTLLLQLAQAANQPVHTGRLSSTQAETVIGGSDWAPIVVTLAVVLGVCAIAALATPIAPLILAPVCEAALDAFAIGGVSGYFGAAGGLVVSATAIAAETH